MHQRTPEDRVININGTNVAGTNPVLRTTQKLQGHLPVFLHKQPRTVLQIGFGSGGTCYSVSLHEEIERIDVCEISPDVIAMSSKYFADIHHNVLDDARVHTHIADARSFVAATSRTFDLILSDSIHPRFRGNAALYTVDYFALCARRLKPGGIVSTWLPLYGLSVDDVRSVLKSMRAVFPHVQVWYPNAVPNENTVILASMEPLTIDVPRLETELARPVLAEDLAEVGIRSVLEFVDAFLMGDRAVSRFTAKGRLNTDDHPYLEFLAPKTLDRFGSWRDNLEALVASRERINPYLEGASPEFLAELDRWQTGTERKLAAQVLELQGRPDEAVRAYDEAIFQNPDDLPTRRRLVALRASLRSRP